MVYHALVKKHIGKLDLLVESLERVLGEGQAREQLGHAVEKAFGFLGPRFKIQAFAREVSFRCKDPITDRFKREYGAWKELTLVCNENTVPVNGLPRLPEEKDGGKELFFKVPDGTPLFDFASARGDIVNLFQVTVSDTHSVSMKGLDLVPAGFKTINFFMIRVALCPNDREQFELGKGVTPLIGNQEARERFAEEMITKRRMNYYECIWPLYAACDDWTREAVKAACEHTDTVICAAVGEMSEVEDPDEKHPLAAANA
jgi:hypothetical protein